VNFSDCAQPPGPSAFDPQSSGNGSESARVGRAAAELAFHGATKVYPGRRTPAVSNLTLEVAAGEICVPIGPSGSGKTTAMQMVNRLIPMTLATSR
jgi:osmoprotectant transport system ATP-binding protein